MVTAFAIGWAAFAGDVVLRSLALFALCGLNFLLLRRASASTRAYSWRLTFVALLALPALQPLLPPLSFSTPLLHATPSPAQPSMPAPSVALPATGWNALIIRNTAPIREIHESAPTQADAASHPRSLEARHSEQSTIMARPTAAWRALLFVLWLVGVLLALCRMGAGLAALRRLEACTTPAAGALAALTAQLAQATAPGHRVRVRVADAGTPNVSPLTWGAIRPALLLPAGADEWPEERLRAVLLHELAHIERNDWSSQLLADFVRACYWFHPLVWLAARQLRRENELACDDRVLACGLRASDYASHLLDIVRMRKTAVRPPGGAISMAQPALLETRLRALLDERRSRYTPSRGARAAGILLLGALLVPLAATRVVANAARPNASPAPPPLSVARFSTVPTPTQPERPEMPAFTRERRALFLAGRPGIRATWPAINEQSGASLERERLTHLSSIAWGRANGGLQIGLERADGQGTVVHGQHISLRIWLRNTGHSPINLWYPDAQETQGSYRAELTWRTATVHDTDVTLMPEYHVVRTHGPLAGGGNGNQTPALRVGSSRLTLQPGAERLLPGPVLRFLVIPIGDSMVTEPTLFLTPGKKAVTVAPFLSWKMGTQSYQTAVTGALPLEVVATGNTAVAPHDEPITKPEAAKVQDVAWGVATDGLQAGIRLTGKQLRFLPGERIPLECYIRNVTEHEIAFTYAYRVYMDELPSVRDAAAPQNAKKVQGVFLTGLDSAFALILKPGESVVLWHPGILLGNQPEARSEPGTPRTGLERWPFLEEPTPGDYLVKQSLRYHISTPEEVGQLGKQSRAKDTIRIKPYRVMLIQADGKRKSEDASVLPFSDERVTLITGDARFTIAANAAPGEPNPQKPAGDAHK